MTWQDPKTWNTGDLLTSQDMNAQLRDNLRYLKAPPYGQKTVRQATNYATNSGNFVDIDASALSLTLRVAGAAEIGFLGTFQMNRPGTLYLDLSVDGVRIGNDLGMAHVYFSAANQRQSFAFTVLRDELTPGERIFRLQWSVSIGAATLFAAAGRNDPPAYFWARALP